MEPSSYLLLLQICFFSEQGLNQGMVFIIDNNTVAIQKLNYLGDVGQDIGK